MSLRSHSTNSSRRSSSFRSSTTPTWWPFASGIRSASTTCSSMTPKWLVKTVVHLPLLFEISCNQTPGCEIRRHGKRQQLEIEQPFPSASHLFGRVDPSIGPFQLQSQDEPHQLDNKVSILTLKLPDFPKFRLLLASSLAKFCRVRQLQEPHLLQHQHQEPQNARLFQSWCRSRTFLLKATGH